MAAPAVAQEDFTVVTVPWVGTTPEVPHDGVVGQPHYLQAVARNCDGAIEYRWDYDGNGVYDMEWAAAPDRWNLGTQFTYDGLEQTRLFIARVEGRCGGAEGPTATADFPVRMHVDPTRNVRVNRAISNGLWFGHISLVRDVATRTARFGAAGGNWADTALLAQAMMNRGHKHGVDPATDPYVENVLWMLHHVLRNYVTVAAPGPQAGEEADVNGNGIVLEINEGGVHGGANYVGGGCLEAIASWPDHDYIIPDDIGAPQNVAGRRLADVVQDAAEFYIYSQTDIAFEGGIAGGWDYDINSGTIDSSQVGWAAVGLFAAREATGADVPAWVTERLERGVRYMDYGLATGGAATGGYGYRSRGQAAYQGNPARSGAMLNALGFATDGDRDHPSVVATVDFIARAFDAPPQDGFGGETLGNYYAMFQISKGMRSFEPQFELIGEANVDWYARLADYLIGVQTASGRFQGDVRWTGNREITHSLGMLVLIPTLFEAPPTAVAQATPRSVGPGDEVSFYHGGSYALDPEHPIVTYRWDFVRYPEGLDLNGDGDFDDAGEHAPEDLDGDGLVTGDEIVWEFETNDPQTRPTWAFQAEIDFGDVVEFEVNLQVEDDLGRVDDDRESVVIEVSYVNHPPVAVGRGDGGDTYEAAPGALLRLDGGSSFDPDSDDEPADGFPRDGITSYAWDLNGDGLFETEGEQVEYLVDPAAEIGSTRVVRLQVCDDGTWLGVPDAECEGGDCSLCGTTDVRITIVPIPPPDIDLGGEDAFEAQEGKRLVIDTSGTRHQLDLDFELLVFCEGLGASAALDNSSITIDAGLVDGLVDPQNFDCTVTAIDELDSVSTADFTVSVVNIAPEVLSARVVGEPVEGGTVDIAIQASDVPGDAPFLLYSVDCDGDGRFEVRNTRNNIVECPLDDGRYDPIVQVDDQDGGVVLVELDGFDVANIPPSFADIECPMVTEGELMVLQIGVSDPADAVTCSLGAPRPDQAQVPGGDCTLIWTPTYAQALQGRVDFTILADDGDGGTAELGLSCFPMVRDNDGDGLPDSWEERFGTDPTVDDCEVDYDGDGMDNCEEYENDTLPRVYEGPGMPQLIEPVGGVIVDTATPQLLSRNTTDDLGRDLDYVYWLYETADGPPIHMSDPVGETPNETAYRTPGGLLEENQTYYWTVAASNGRVIGPSPQRARFVVDAVEEPAPAPRIITPADGGMSPDGIPPIGLTPVTDPDPGDELTYECQAATDADFEDVAGQAGGEEIGGQVSVLLAGLAGDTTYYIRCRALDQDGNPGLWSDPITYAINEAPIAAVDPPVLEIAEGGDGQVLSASSDPDDGELTHEWRCPDALGIVADGPTLNVDAAIDGPAGGRTFQCRLTVTDAHGASDSTDFVVRVYNVAPMAEVVCPPVEEGTPVQILIEGTDPGGDQIACSWAMAAPAASELAGCTVEWTPTYAQAIAGEVHFSVRLTDDDGASTDVPFTCNPTFLDGDGNGLPDTWEDDNGIDDPDGDDDGDGVSNGDEWADGTDPNQYDGPAPLSLVSPVGDEIVATPTPMLVVNNGSDGLDRPLTYRYAIFETADAEEPMATSALVDEGDETTAWQVPADVLAENGRFWWTAQADNGVQPGPWADRESFRIDETAEAPDPPTILRPTEGDAVDDTPVRVTLQNSTDPDPDAELTYDCQMAVDREFEQQVGSGEAVEGPEGTTRVDIEALVGENESYWIRCRATDETGLESGWSEPVKVGIDRTNEPPSAPTLIDPAADSIVEPGDISFTVGDSVDPEGDALTYYIQVSTDPDFLDLLFSASMEAADNRATFGPETLSPGVWYVRTWAHDGLLAGEITVESFQVVDPNTGDDTINGGGCACDVSETTTDPVGPLAALLGLLILGLRRRQR